MYNETVAASAAAAAAESSSVSSAKCTHEVYVWRLFHHDKITVILQSFPDELTNGYFYIHFTYVTMTIHNHVRYRSHFYCRYDEVAIIQCMSRDEVLEIEGMKKYHNLKITKKL